MTQRRVRKHGEYFLVFPVPYFFLFSSFFFGRTLIISTHDIHIYSPIKFSLALQCFVVLTVSSNSIRWFLGFLTCIGIFLRNNPTTNFVCTSTISLNDLKWRCCTTVIGIFLSSATFCLAASAFYHTSCCHSQKVRHKHGLTVGSFYPSIYCGFFCDFHVQAFYLVTITIAGLGKIMIVFLLWSSCSSRT